MADEIKRDRMNGYVDPKTTEVIEMIKKEQLEENFLRVTYGQAIDIMAAAYKQGKGWK